MDPRRLLPPLLFAAIFSFASLARADKVAVLGFASGGSATTSAQLDEARASTRAAVTKLNHTLPSDSEMLTAQMAVKDGVADTSDEYRAAGRASSATWTIAGHVDARGPTYRLELEVCQVESGRVESLAREIDAKQAAPQIQEMLALLLRREGIGNSEAPWEHPASPPTVAPPVNAQTTATAPPLPPREPPPPAPPYAEGHPFAAGVSIGVASALHRLDNARGSSTAAILGAQAGYAIASVPGLELRAGLDAAVAGPQSVSLDLGARYLFAIAPRARLYVGPELGVGGFFVRGGDRDARFLVRGAAAGVWGITDRVQIELVPEIDWAAGGTGALVLGGASIRGAFRF